MATDTNGDAHHEPGDQPADPGKAPTTWSGYTRTGDAGQTSLGDHSRTDKTDPRVIAYGDCEEVVAFLGYAVNVGTGLGNDMVRMLTRVQNDMIDVAADISAPVVPDDAEHLRIDHAYLTRLERACDHFGADLAPPVGVVLPGGTATAALLYYCYALARRTERSIAEVCRRDSAGANVLTRQYVNRLASLMSVLARNANSEHGDTPWEPGLSAQLGDTDLWEALDAEPDET